MSELNRKAETLYRIIVSANQAEDLGSLLEAILKSTLEMVDFDAGAIYLLNEKRETVALHCHRGLSPGFIEEVRRYSINDPYSGHLFVEKKPLYIENFHEFKPDRARKYGIASVAIIPLIYRDRAIGSLNLSRTTPHHFTPEDKDLLNAIGRETGASIARMQAETALRESERRYKELADSLPESVYEIDLEGNVLFANATAYRVFNYGNDALAKGLNVFSMLDERDIEHAAHDFSRLLAGESIGPVEYLVRRGDGSTFPAVLHSVPTVRDGVLTGFHGVLVDASVINRTKEALRESEARFRAVAEATASGIYIRQDDRFVYANPAMEKISGYSAEEILSMKRFEQFIHPESIPFMRERIVRCRAGDMVPTRYELKIIRKDGGQLWVDLSSSAIVYDNRPARIGTFFDINDRRRAEEELARAQKLESLGVLAGGIAHDFNNILTVIAGNISLARMQTDPGSRPNRVLEDAEKASFRARDLTRQLLTFSRGGAPIKKVTPIAALLEETILFALSGTNILPEFDIAGDLRAAEVDPGQMSQVFNNLAINARQAMPAGGTVRVTACNTVVSGPSGNAGIRPGKYLKISIEDHGIGIPAELQARIFDPYFTTKQRGSGLGLTTSYSIVNRHGGHIEVSSMVGEGSVFTLHIPATDEKPRKIKASRKSPRRSMGRILIMDDDESVLSVGAGMLSALGYTVETARDGNSAIMLYERFMESGAPFDAVILDLTIPGGPGGLDTLKKLAGMDERVRAVVSSGYSGDPVMSDYEGYGFAGIVAKPYTIEEMASVLEAVIKLPRP